MKFVRKLILLFLVCGLAQQASAQSLFDIQAISPVPDTLNIGQNDTIYVSLINRGPNQFNGTISFKYAINDSIYQVPDVISGISYDSLSAISIDSGDTVNSIIYVHPGPPKFQTGPSVVVIWPIGVFSPLQLITRDSLKFELFVRDTATSIDSLDTLVNNINEPVNTQLYYYNHQVWLKSDGGTGLNRVRIYDATGHLIYNGNVANKNGAPIPNLPLGVYIAEAVLSNNLTVHLKFIETPH